jgi:hypothetical protein
MARLASGAGSEQLMPEVAVTFLNVHSSALRTVTAHVPHSSRAVDHARARGHLPAWQWALYALVADEPTLGLADATPAAPGCERGGRPRCLCRQTGTGSRAR